jgi:hypothetical protein
MKAIIAAALTIGVAMPAVAQDWAAGTANWGAGTQSSPELARHRAGAFVQSIQHLPVYRNEPAWQAYAQHRGGGASEAFAQADIPGQRVSAAASARRTNARARRARAQDAFAQADIGDRQLYRRNSAALQAYAARFRQNAEQNPLNAYSTSIRDYRIRLGYAPWHVYDTIGDYVGSDPDPHVRGMLAFDPPGRND